MNKQILSFVSLVALAVTHPSIRLVAAPPGGPASTEESDRKFLANLENNDAAKPAPSKPAPVASTPQPKANQKTAAASSKSSTRRIRDVVTDQEGTHIIRPAEIAQYGVAPTVPTKTTKVTTTEVQQPTTVTILKEDRDESRNEDRNQERRFFDRLFHGGLFKKHSSD